MSVYKPRKDSRKYYLSFTDHQMRRQRIPGFPSKRETQRFHDRIVDLVSVRASNAEPAGELRAWMDGLPMSTQRRLADIDLIDKKRLGYAKTLAELVDEYRAFLEAQGKSESHITGTINRVKRLFNFCGFRHLNEINTAAVSRFIKEFDGSDTTKNHYITAAKMFFNYLIEAGQLTANPLKGFKKLAEDRERKGVLTADQYVYLIDYTAKHGATIRHTSGIERSMLYMLAGSTGLRRKELLALRWDNMRLETKTPEVFLDGRFTKNKQDAHQPLTQDIVKAFTAWKAQKGASGSGRVFDTITLNHRTAEFIRADLTAAGLPLEDRAGNQINFHSLRNSYISFLANSSTPAKVVQQLARHSSIDLTMNVYARLTAESELDAIQHLPKLSNNDQLQQQKKTGTYDTKSVDASVDMTRQNICKFTDKSGLLEMKKETAKNSLDDIENAIFEPKTGILQSTPDRIRTCDLRIRNPLHKKISVVKTGTYNGGTKNVDASVDTRAHQSRNDDTCVDTIIRLLNERRDTISPETLEQIKNLLTVSSTDK